MSVRNVRPAVKLLVERDGKILILSANTGTDTYWILPGGKIEYGEAPRDALNREIQEELSCEAYIGEPIGMYHFYQGSNNTGDEIVVTVFDGKLQSNKINTNSNPADENITNHHWLPPSEIAQESGAKHLKEFLHQYAESGQ